MKNSANNQGFIALISASIISALLINALLTSSLPIFQYRKSVQDKVIRAQDWVRELEKEDEEKFNNFK